MHHGFRIFAAVVLCSAALVLGSGAQAVTIDWVTVGAAGNVADTTGYGAVADAYQIGKYEVTNTQYVEFLNAVAATDTYALFNLAMTSFGGITRSGSSGGYTYSAVAGDEFMPVHYVSFYASLRFANWLHNGQPTGVQDSTTTEDGAYTFSGATSVGARNLGATVFLPSEDEWYKAAYYDPMSSVYYAYPAGTDTQIVCATPGATANTANCNNVVGVFTDVGSYTGSVSPNGTFDQGGNAWEWNEAIVSSNRGTRGGGYEHIAGVIAASNRLDYDPSSGHKWVGFRVAGVPEPGKGVLLMTALLTLACVQRVRA